MRCQIKLNLSDVLQNREMATCFLQQGCRGFGRICLERNFISLTCVRAAHKYSHADVKPSRYTTIYRNLHGAIDDPSTAKDFVYALNRKERELLLQELQKFNIDSKPAPIYSTVTEAQAERPGKIVV